MGRRNPRCDMNWPSRNTGQCKLKEMITYETSTVGISARKPKSSTVSKGK